jgi:hypothetical protein
VKNDYIKNTIKILSLIILGGAVGFFSSKNSQVAAQISNSNLEMIALSIAPTNTYVAIRPGESFKQSITLKNKSNQNLNIKSELLSFTGDGKTGRTVLLESTHFKYLQIKDPQNPELNLNQEFPLLANETKKIEIEIKLPEKIIETEHRLSLLFKAEPQVNSFTAGPAASGAIATNFIVLISKDLSDQAEISIKQIESQPFPAWPIIDSLMPLKFKILAQNTGQNSSTASASATLKNWQGKTIKEFEFEPDLILSGSSRYLRLKPDLNNPDHSKPNFDPTVIEHHSPLLLGSYLLEVEIWNNSSPQAQTTTYTGTVIALPFSFLLLLILGAIIYTGYGLIIAKYKQNKKRKK